MNAMIVLLTAKYITICIDNDNIDWHIQLVKAIIICIDVKRVICDKSIMKCIADWAANCQIHHNLSMSNGTVNRHDI